MSGDGIEVGEYFWRLIASEFTELDALGGRMGRGAGFVEADVAAGGVGVFENPVADFIEHDRCGKLPLKI